MFTVHSGGVFTQDKSGYFSNSKVYGKNGTGKKGCSLIRGVHYERFHCTVIKTNTILTQLKGFGVGASITIQGYEPCLSNQHTEVLHRHEAIHVSDQF